MRRPLIAGNWKMHGTQKSAEQLLKSIAENVAAIPDIEFAVFPPFVHLHLCVTLLRNSTVQYGAQTLSEYPDGAYTGEISASMLKDLGCRYVIIGHSERRRIYGETDAQIAKKGIAALKAGLTPILCVGETLSEREKDLTLSVIQEQLEVISIFKDNCSNFAGTDLVIAYEPVWAIGTGKTATPEQAQNVHAAIRAQLPQTRILYGGSVKPDNASALFSMPDIDGALVGGASLDAKSFLKIANAC